MADPLASPEPANCTHGASEANGHRPHTVRDPMGRERCSWCGTLLTDPDGGPGETLLGVP
jgi:hypothetical protein